MEIQSDRSEVSWLKIRPIRGKDELEELRRAACVDGHGLLFPSHGLWRGTVPVGALSVATVPMVSIWLDTKQAHVRESLAAMTFYEGMTATQGAPVVIVPCRPNSPLFPFMEKVGYENHGLFTLFAKEL